MAEFVGVPVVMVGVGPGRDDVIWTSASENTVAGRLAAAAS
jgi:adenylosuccinate synthase